MHKISASEISVIFVHTRLMFLMLEFRNMAAISQGNIYIVCSGANTIGVVWVTQ